MALLTPEPSVPGVFEGMCLPMSRGETRGISMDEWGSSCWEAQMASIPDVPGISESNPGSDPVAALMSNSAAAASSEPELYPPGVPGKILALHPPFSPNRGAISSAVCALRPTMPTMMEQHMLGGYATSIPGPVALALLPREESPPGVAVEIPSLAAVPTSGVKIAEGYVSNLKHLGAKRGGSASVLLLGRLLLPSLGVILLLRFSAVNAGMASRFPTPSYVVFPHFPLPPPPLPPPPPPPPPPPLPLPQRHMMLSGQQSQMPRLGLCEENENTGMTRSSFMPDKQKLTVFVGKIVPSLTDDFVSSMLKLCGSVRSWTRAKDPLTGSLKGFGFCEYESPEGLLRALRLLNRLKLEGQELLLKVDQTTLDYLEHYVDKKIQWLHLQMDAEAESAPGVGATHAVQPLTFDVPREVPIEERLGWVCDKENEIDKEVCEKLVSLLEERDWKVSLDLSSWDSGFDMAEVDKVQGSPTEESSQRVKLMEWKQFEYALERCKLRGRGSHGGCRGSDSYYLEYEKLWEEREIAKENQRYMERERDLAKRKMRQRLLKEQEESGRYHKRRCNDEKYKKRLLEKGKDDAKLIQEQQESGCSAAFRSRGREANYLPKGELSQNKFLDLSTRAKIAFCFKSSSRQRPSQQLHMPTVGGDSFWGGDEQGHKQRKQAASTVHCRNPTFTWDREGTPEEQMSIGEKERAPVAKEPIDMYSDKRPIVPETEWPSQQMHMSVAGGDSFWGGEEQSYKQRKQVLTSTVHYRNPTFTWDRESTPEEQMSIPEKERAQAAKEPIVMYSEKQPVIPVKERPLNAKELIDTIPTTKNEIFAFYMDWATFDEHCLHERIRPWVSKKIAECLGEEEVTLVDYIVTCARKHMTPTHLLDLLEKIFVEEAEQFVVKLWRMVIYEIKKVECGLSRG